jgi:HK97 family phage prohead protease
VALAHEPVGKPGGPGLWHDKRRQLPAYIQHIANDLRAQRGMTESEAIATAISVCKKWAAGGKDVHPDTRAKAAAAIAEWERLKASTKVRRSEAPMSDGTYDADGLAGKARKGGGMSRSGGDWRQLTRPFMAEDLHIMRAAEGESSGRVVEGYAAVFNQPQPIRDHQGEYTEVIDPHAFDAALARMSSRRGGIGAAVRVLFNHGKTIEGQPAAEFQKPIGRAQAIIPDSRGLLTRTEFNRTALAEEVLELIRSGSITGMSFQGPDLRSDPPLRGPGDRYRRAAGGALATVRRMAVGLMEYSPVVFEAYPGAEFLGVVRMGTADTYEDVTATDGGLTGYEEDLPDMNGDGSGGTPAEVTLTRDHAHRLLVTRMQEQCQRAGLVLPGRG